MEQNINYYERNKEARREYQRQYYAKNRERIRAKRRMEELKDPEKFEARKNYNKQYYLKHKAKILQSRAEAYAKKKEASKKEIKSSLD